jgi:hypothetical protein
VQEIRNRSHANLPAQPLPEYGSLSVNFALEKWYFDVVAPDARVRIAYVAKVVVGGVTLHYASVLRADATEPTMASTLRGVTMPAPGGSTWACTALGIEVSVVATAAPIDARILETDRGRLDWLCFAPRADVVGRDGDNEIAGVGYAEVLRMSIPPWSLPWNELRWGRAHVGDETFVWIKTDTAARVYVNGHVGDMSELELELDRDRVLRDGVIGKTVLSIVPGSETLFPGRILGLMETKWLSRARTPRGTGFAIHEVVRWPA